MFNLIQLNLRMIVCPLQFLIRTGIAIPNLLRFRFGVLRLDDCINEEDFLEGHESSQKLWLLGV